MKRSRFVTLSLMAGASTLLAGCGQSESKVVTYSSLDDCIKDNTFTADQCRTQYQKALQENKEHAPHYTQRNACERDFGYGQCEDRGSFWAPFMAGFMMNMVAQNVHRGSNVYYSSSYGAPLYRSSDDRRHYRSASNHVVGRTGMRKPITVYDDVLRSKGSSSSYHSSGSFGKRAPTISRGGFGRSSSARGSWGGGRSWGG